MKLSYGLLISLLSALSSPSYADSPPFAMAKKIGNVLYLSGQIGSIKPGEPPLVKGGIQPETHQAMKNIQQVLKDNGSSLSQVFKCTVMMADMKEWPIMNEIYRSYFADKNYPARSAFGTSGLALNARVEIECLATVNNKLSFAI